MLKKVIIGFLMFFMAACSLTPEYQRPAVEAPAQWHEPPLVDANAVPVRKTWWQSFDSAELDLLMKQALAQNNDIWAGLYRVEQARAALRIAGADLLPAIDASADMTDTRRSRGDKGATNWHAGAAVSYELDLFGANRAGVRGAAANLAASKYNQQALKLVVMGDVAKTYFAVLNARTRLGIADKNLANAREILRIVKARLAAGAVSALEVAQQETAVAGLEASRATLEQQMKEAENALMVLLGRPPGAAPVAASNLEALTVPVIAPIQPSRLLEHRPDIRAAEADLIAANADIGVARAAFFPKIDLGLDGGLAAAAFGGPVTASLAAAASLATPIFQGGRLEGGVEQATARQKELVEVYRKTVLIAFREVEDALAAVKTTLARERALAAAVEEARRSYNLSKLRFDAGAIDFQTFLNTQAALLNAEDSYATARADRLSAAVDLFKALGGGWKGGS